MDLKSLDPQQITIDEIKKYKSFEFAKLYESAAETKREKLAKKKKLQKSNKNPQQEELDTLKPSLSSNKNARKKSSETLDLSNIESVEHTSINTSSIKSNLTSTPNNKSEHLDNGVKSIMKNNKSNNLDSLLKMSSSSIPSTKPKKRNKSVSFMLEDAEEVVVKKSKSNNPSKELKNKNKQQNIKGKVENSTIHKQKKNRDAKENLNVKEKTKLNNKENFMVETMVKNDNKHSTLVDVSINEDHVPCGVKKKVKKTKKSRSENKIEVELPEVIVSEEQCPENKSKKLKKKKRKVRSTEDDNVDAEGEPAIKTRKKDLKPEVIAKGLENLNIGDNAHTLTNLLDEMTVVDKNAKKKNRQKLKKNKQTEPLLTANDNPEKEFKQDSIGEKEKIKWRYRRWNKDVKGNNTTQKHTSVVVDNLPLKIMCDYKSLLSKHFNKFGAIAGIGVVETYPTEDLKPVFTTTIYFQNEESVTKALEEDNTLLEGSRIRVRRPLSPAETTVVVHAYGLSDQALSSMFSGAGRIRAIRINMRKKAKLTGFVEFDGPEAVERAMKIGEDAKLNGKKVIVSKFDISKKTNYGRKRSSEKNPLNEGDSDSSIE